MGSNIFTNINFEREKVTSSSEEKEFVIQFSQEEIDKALSQEQISFLEKVKSSFLFCIDELEEPGKIRLLPMNGDEFITINSKEEAKIFIGALRDYYRKL